MIIEVNAKQRIVGTSTCWQIELFKNDKKGGHWEPKYFYNSLDMAAKELYHKNIRKIQESDVGKIMNEMQKHMEEIKNALLPATIKKHQQVIKESCDG